MAAVITDCETHRKKSINDVSIIPHVCVLDAALTTGLPPEITANTGLDALCHAIEAYTNSTYNTQTENDMAKKAVKLIHDNLYKAYNNGGDIEARQNMQRAAFYAGRAFTRGCVGYVHAIGHGIGGFYGLPHGRAMAVLLPQVMKAYGGAVYKKLAELADVCGIGAISSEEALSGGISSEEVLSDGDKASADVCKNKAEAFIGWIEDANKKMGIPKSFDCIKENDIPTIAKWADKEANPLYPVPKIFNTTGLAEIVRAAMAK